MHHFERLMYVLVPLAISVVQLDISDEAMH